MEEPIIKDGMLPIPDGLIASRAVGEDVPTPTLPPVKAPA